MMLVDVLPKLSDAQRKELQDAVLEACLAYQLNQCQAPGDPPIDWSLPIKRRLYRYPAGRLHKVYAALLREGATKIDYFASVMSGTT